jgi:hypothetical protein
MPGTTRPHTFSPNTRPPILQRPQRLVPFCLDLRRLLQLRLQFLVFVLTVADAHLLAPSVADATEEDEQRNCPRGAEHDAGDCAGVGGRGVGNRRSGGRRHREEGGGCAAGCVGVRWVSIVTLAGFTCHAAAIR